MEKNSKENKDNKKNENLVVYGIYPTRQMVEDAVIALEVEGFRRADISVLFSSPETSKEFAHTKETKAPEGALYGGGTGAVVGGTLGLLAGVGAIAIPGVGPFIAAGPIMGLLAGAGAGSVTGGLLGVLVGLGFPEYEAKRYEGRIKDGGILLSVHADNKDWKNKAVHVLEDSGAEDISFATESNADFKDEGTPTSYHI
jgi:hypothetical protein